MAAKLLARAAELAFAEHPHPNPRVGCVIATADGRIVAEGSHKAAGEAHAEVAALGRLAQPADAMTMYVTLEPCAHHGRTPPCAEAIVAAGISRVVIGALDPDPSAEGGVATLRRSGVDVVVVPEDSNTEWVDPGYFRQRRTGLPFVTVKVASTLDGQVAAADGTSQWITGEAARRDAHWLRSRTDAVLVGAGTVRSDDPRLDVRIDGYTGSQPTPVVVAGATPLPPHATIFSRSPLVFRTAEGSAVAGDDLVVGGTAATVSLTDVMAELGTRGIIDVLVEGGPRVVRSLLEARLAQRIVWYVAGKIGGGTGLPAVAGNFATLTDAVGIEVNDVVRLGSDTKIVADLVKAH